MTLLFQTLIDKFFITEKDIEEHSREETLFSLLLMIFTTWFALKICQIKTTSFFNQTTRDLISSYALPISILSISLVSNFLCQDMTFATFEYQPSNNLGFHYLDFTQLEAKTLLVSIGLGFCLSLVFFMSQSISIGNVQFNIYITCHLVSMCTKLKLSYSNG